MEVMQSAFLTAFLIIAMILHPKRFDETILDFYQDAGIWIVIASCVAEYLLLLTYIGVAAYDFFKNRKNKTTRAAIDSYKRLEGGFIHYDQTSPSDGRPASLELPNRSKAPIISFFRVIEKHSRKSLIQPRINKQARALNSMRMIHNHNNRGNKLTGVVSTSSIRGSMSSSRLNIK